MNKRIVSLLLSVLVALSLVAGLSISVLAQEHDEDDPKIILQDGQGNEKIIWDQGSYTLPTIEDCGFTAPEGQRFKCWLVDGKEKQPGEKIYTDFRTVITADWEDLPVVSFDAAGGDGAMKAVTTEGKYALPECEFTAPEGQQFKCWLVDEEEKQPGDEIEVQEKITVTACWEDLPVVSFDADGGDGTMDTVATYGAYALPKCEFAAPEGQQFKCWLVDGEEKQPGDEIKVLEDITVTAIWEEVPEAEDISQTVGATEIGEKQRESDDDEDSGMPWWIYVLIAVGGVAFGVIVAVLIQTKKKD